MAGKYDDILAAFPDSQKTQKYDDILSAFEEKKPSAFERFGKALPVAGSVLGGIAGGVGGTVAGFGVGGVPGAVGGATLGGAAGESARQLLGRAMGEKAPQTSTEAAKEIGIEGAMGGAGELTGIGVGRLAAKGFKAFPKIASGVSGTPANNIARAQKRGFKVFAPGISREAAGTAQGAVEAPIMAKYFSPKEIAKFDLNDVGFANETVNKAYVKILTKKPLTPKEALAVRKAAPTIRAADTLKGIKKNVALDKTFQEAREVITKQFPELSDKLVSTEKAITASQLRIPLRVNKTNPNQISGLTTTLGPMLGLPAMAATIPFSPLSMGLAGATMGQVKRSVPKLARRGIQRGAIQSLERTLGE